jgi:hypothetical protein
MKKIKRQVGVTLQDIVKAELEQVAKIEQRSVSSIGAEAIHLWLRKWILKSTSKPKVESK